jgi:hypothetical protein
MNTLRKSSGVAIVLALGISGLAVAGGTASAAGATARLKPTSFELEASGYASKLVGGQLPTGSDKVAYTVVSCTNKAGVQHVNTETDGDLGNGLSFQGATTRAWTTKKGQKVSAWSRHRINKVTLLDTPLGDLSLRAIVSTSHAWHDKTGFHGKSTSTLGAIEFAPIVGPPQQIPIPSPGQSVTVPGLAQITLGTGKNVTNAKEAITNTNGLFIHLLLTDTSMRIAHTRAAINNRVQTAMYHGSAYATKLTALSGILTSGRTVPTSVPCTGSGGKWTSNKTSHADLSTSLLASGLSSRQRSGLTGPGKRPEVTAISRIGRVNLGAGLEVQVIRARAHAVKKAHGYGLDISGTSVGGITYNGQEQTFPLDQNVMEIPGVAKFERAIVTRGAHRISVTALRVTLLDGTQAVTVLDLGNATAGIVPSGL